MKKSTVGMILQALLFAVLLVLLVLILVRWSSLKKTGTAEAQVQVVEAPQQEAPMEHPAFVKEEYVSIVPDGVNIAKKAKFIDASSYEDIYVPRKVVDGNVNGGSYWEGKADTYPNELELKYEEDRTIHALKLCLCPKPIWGKRTQEFSVQISTDGETYTELIPQAAYEFTPDRDNEVVLEFDPVTIRGIKLIFTSNTGAGGAQLAELQIYSMDDATSEEE